MVERFPVAPRDTGDEEGVDVSGAFTSGGDAPSDSPPTTNRLDPDTAYNISGAFGGAARDEPGFAGNLRRAVVGGALGTLGSMAAFGEYLGGSGGAMSSARDSLEGAAREQLGGMSQGWRTASERQFLPGGDGPSAYESPGAFFGALGTQVSQALPSMVATLLPAGLVARGLALAGNAAMAAPAAGATAGALAGSMGGGAVWQGITDAIRNAPESELMESAFYRTTRERLQAEGQSPEQADASARELLAREGRTGAYPAIAAAFTAVSAGLLEGGLASAIGTGAIRRTLQGMMQGVRAEGLQEAGEGVVQEGLTQAGLNESLGRPYDPRRIAEQGVQGAVVGGALGGAIGGVVGPRVRNPGDGLGVEIDQGALSAAREENRPMLALPPPADRARDYRDAPFTVDPSGTVTPPPPAGVDPAAAAAISTGRPSPTPTAASATPTGVATAAGGASRTPSSPGALDPALAAAAGASAPSDAGAGNPLTADARRLGVYDSIARMSSAGWGVDDVVQAFSRVNRSGITPDMVLAVRMDMGLGDASPWAASAVPQPNLNPAPGGVPLAATPISGAGGPSGGAAAAQAGPAANPLPVEAAPLAPPAIAAAPNTPAQPVPTQPVPTQPVPTQPALAPAAPTPAMAGMPAAGPPSANVLGDGAQRRLDDTMKAVRANIESQVARALAGAQRSAPPRADVVESADAVLARVRDAIAAQMAADPDLAKASISKLATLVSQQARPQLAEIASAAAQRQQEADAAEERANAERTRAEKEAERKEAYKAKRKTDQERLGTKQRGLAVSGGASREAVAARIKAIKGLLDIKSKNFASDARKLVNAAKKANAPLPDWLEGLDALLESNAGRGGKASEKAARINAWRERVRANAERYIAEAEAQFNDTRTATRNAVAAAFTEHAPKDAGTETTAEFAARIAAMDKAMDEALGGRALSTRMAAVDDSIRNTESAEGAVLYWLEQARINAGNNSAAAQQVRKDIVSTEAMIRGIVAKGAEDADGAKRNDILESVRSLREIASEQAGSLGSGGGVDGDSLSNDTAADPNAVLEEPSDDVVDNDAGEAERIAADSTPEDAVDAQAREGEAEFEAAARTTAAQAAMRARREAVTQNRSQAEANEIAQRVYDETLRENAKRVKALPAPAESTPAAEAAETAETTDVAPRRVARIEKKGDARQRFEGMLSLSPEERKARLASLIKLLGRGVRLSDSAERDMGAMARAGAGQRFTLDSAALNRLFKPRSGEAGKLDRLLWMLVRSRIGAKTQVAVVSNAEWDRVMGRDAERVPAAFLQNTVREIAAGRGPGTIIMPERTLEAGDAESMLHEAVHAAVAMTVAQGGPHARAMEKLRAKLESWVDDNLPSLRNEPNVAYALSDVNEFVAMAMSNDLVQTLLADIQLTPAEARALGVTPSLMSRITSMFQAMVDAVRRMFGVPNNMQTGLEAVIRVADRAMQTSAQQEAAAQKADAENDSDADTESDNDVRLLVRGSSTVDDMMRRVGRETASTLRDTLVNTEERFKGWTGFLTLRQLEQIASDLFAVTPRLKAVLGKIADSDYNPLKHVSRALTERAQIAERFVDEHFTPVLKALQALPADQRAELSNFLIETTYAQVHPDVALSDPKNKFALDSKKGSMVQARGQHAKLHAQWNKLTAEQQATYHTVVNTTKRVHETIVGDTIEDTIARWWSAQVDLHLGTTKQPLPMNRDDVPALMQRFRDGKESDTDRAMIGSFMDVVEIARDRAKLPGPYIPLQRFGDYVVTWKEDVEAVNRFATEAEAKRFAEQAELPVLAIKTVYYDSKNQEITAPDPTILAVERTKAEGKRATGGKDGGPMNASEWMNAYNAATKRARDRTRKAASRVEHQVILQNQGVSFFATAAEAENFHAELIEQGKKATPPGLRDNVVASGGLLDDQINKAITTLERDHALSAKARAEVTLSLTNTLAQLQPNRLLASHLIKRRRVLGAERDVPRVLANYATGSANYHAALRTTLPVTDGMRALREYTRDQSHAAAGKPSTGESRARGRVVREIETRTEASAYDPAGRGSTNPIIRKMQSMAFVWYLASPAYSMIQMLQPYMFTAPVLAGRYGLSKGVSQLARAMNDIGIGAVLKGGVKDSVSAARILAGRQGADPGDLVGLVREQLKRQSDGAELNAMLDELQREGLVDGSAGLELVRTLKESEGFFGTKLAQSEALARAFPASIEVVNRTATAVAAYRLERQRGGTVAQARAAARQIVDNTQADYSSANTARFMDPKFAGGLLAPMMTFRKFAQAVYFLLGRQIYLAVKGKTKAERREALRTLGYVLLSHQIMAGTLGLPTEPIALVLAAVAMALGEDEPWDWESELRKVAADVFGVEGAEALMRGLPRMAGMDLSSRVGLQGLVFVKDLRDYESQTLAQYAGEFAIGAPGAMFASILQAPRHVANGDYGKALEAVLPKGLRDIVKAQRIAEDGVTTRRGERIDAGEPPSGYETALQALGITPARTAEIYERRNAVQGANRRLSSERVDLMRRWRQADPADRAAIWRDQILPWNQNLPADGAASRITLSNLLSSMREAQRRAQESGAQDYLPRQREFLRQEGRFANTDR